MSNLRNWKSVRLIWLSVLVLLAGCTQIEPKVETGLEIRGESADSKISAPNSYAFSMLAPGANGLPIIYARIVIDQLAADCPSLIGSDGSILATSERPLNPIADVANSSNFMVTVCEGVMTQGISYSNSSGDPSIAAVSLDAATIMVYGDSGCESCSGTQTSPHFQILADLGGTQAKDLILHMGDYNYRGTSGTIAPKVYAYDAGDGLTDTACAYSSSYVSQNSVGSPRPDNWPNWQYDFFESAKSLLGTAPWVFARGNHELCSRAGIGWFYFLGPGSSLEGSGLEQMQCPAQGNYSVKNPGAADFIKLIDPYPLKLAQLQLWVMDSANACDGYDGNVLTENYTSQYNAIAAVTEDNAWVMSHRPIWGYQKPGETSVNKMLQTALARSSSGKLPSELRLSLAGHMHTYESLTFLSDSDRPAQLIVGNSGVSLSSYPISKYFDHPVLVDNEQATGNTVSDYGFLSMSVTSAGSWSGEMLNTSGAVILNCDSNNPANNLAICAVGSD